MQKLLIIDGNAIVHRAFHAYPPTLTTSDGKLINAVYGWFAMLIKVLEEVKPDYLAVCFDRPAPTFRKQMYAGYQASRPKMDDGLSSQITLLHEALEKIDIPIFEIDGYEADDVIGTLAKQAQSLCHPERSEGSSHSGSKEDSSATPQNDSNCIETVILTGDRDLLQLVNEHTKVLAPIIGITKFILFDEATVLEKYSVRPSQVKDYKALVGDASDGYPGVTGIGPKTASSLLKEYDSLENLYAHIADVSERVRQKLATDAEQAALAKKLATIVTDAPVHLRLETCSMQHFTQDKVLAVFDEFGFQSIKKRVGIFSEGKKKEADQLGLL